MNVSNKTVKLSESKSGVIQNKSATTKVIVDNRPTAIVQRKLQSAASKSLQTKTLGASTMNLSQRGITIQRQIYHAEGLRFTALEATQWNEFITGLGTFADETTVAPRIASAEDSFYDPNAVTTIAGEITAIKAIVRALILQRRMDVADAATLDWGQFRTTLVSMATRYGAVTSSGSSGGHASITYNYTAGGQTASIAEETNAHGRTAGNLRTRRGQMRDAIAYYNTAVLAHANQYQ